MNHQVNLLCLLFLSLIGSSSFGQMIEYSYKQKLTGITEQWHRVELPNQLFGETTQDLRDIRIFGITEENDTIEAPYLLKVKKDKIDRRQIEFKTINTSFNTTYNYTFEIPAKEIINQINLDFEEDNFDWKVKLEGSQDQQEWNTILEDYRILSIKNNQTDYQFTTLTFHDSKYKFFRVLISSKGKPKFKSATISENLRKEGELIDYEIKSSQTTQNKEKKQTIIEVKMDSPVRASRLQFNVDDDFDFYRPITIQYFRDSIETEKGWRYNYSHLTSGTLNSIEENGFAFKDLTTDRFKIIIDNKDNQTLRINDIQVQGYVHELIARFTSQVDYYLTYGNESAYQSQYDIERFTSNIPETMTALKLGTPVTLNKKHVKQTTPLFSNKLWLWGIMAIIILVLGWSTLKMIQRGSKADSLK